MISADQWNLLAQAKRGKIRPVSVWGRFLDGFRDEFGFEPLWLQLTPGQDETPIPRILTLVFDRTDQYLVFVPPGTWINVDRDQEAKVKRLLAATFTPAMWSGRPKPTDAVGRIVVGANDFEAESIRQASRQVTPDELAAFEDGLGLGERLWLTNVILGPPIVFVHTRAQAAELEAAGAPATWARQWYEIAKRHDEFDYLTPAAVHVRVDSKENFDTYYQGSWLAYYR